MTQNPMDGSKAKLRLKNTDTNRFKVETGSMPAIKPPTPPPVRSAETPEATQTIKDPLSLRDTATGKLKRVTDTQTSASALAPSQVSPVPDAPQKTETVRLKVVRAGAKPGVSLGAGAPVQILPPTPGINAGTIKLGDRAAPLPAALKSTGLMHRDQVLPPGAPQTTAAVPPALNITATGPATAPTTAPATAPATAPTTGPATAPATQPPVTTPTTAGTAAVTAASAPKGASPTIKINIMRPGTAAKPASEPAAVPVSPAASAVPVSPAASAVPPAPATSAAPEAAAPEAAAIATPNSNTLKIRPATPGAAKAPVNQSASATVKVTPPAAGSPQPTANLKLSLKKEAPAPATPPVQAGTTQAVPPPEEKKGGLKIKTGEGKSLNSAATQAAPLPATAPPAAPEAKVTVTETPAASVSAPKPAVDKGPGMVETIAAVAACLAMLAGAVRIVMDLMQQF